MQNDSQQSASDDAAENIAQGSAAQDLSFEPSDERPIFLTEAAVAAVKGALKEEGEDGDGLRVAVAGGGCSGYQYDLNFDKGGRMGDISIEFDGVQVFIDSVSAGLLRGTVIDYVSGLNGTGFKFNNPNANRTCGCGSSFG